MLTGTVTAVTFKGVHYEIIVDVQGFKWMIQSTDYAAVDQTIGMFIEPDAIHIMHKSEFSELYGDYSSFSDEFDTVPGTEGLDEYAAFESKTPFSEPDAKGGDAE